MSNNFYSPQEDRYGKPEDWLSVENYGLHYVPLVALVEEAREVIEIKMKAYKKYEIFGREAKLPLSKLRWTLQEKVNKKRIESYASDIKPDVGIPLVLFRRDITVIDYQDSFLILDGNHRVCSLRAQNMKETTELRVVIV